MGQVQFTARKSNPPVTGSSELVVRTDRNKDKPSNPPATGSSELVAWTDRNKDKPLIPDLMGAVFGVLSRKELFVAELVSQSWRMAALEQWNARAIQHHLSGIPCEMSQNKQRVSQIYRFDAEGWNNAFDVDIGPVPDISPAACQQLSQQDPWDKTKTIGDSSVFMYLPSVCTITVIDSALDLEPSAIAGKAPSLVERAHAIPGKRSLIVPITLRNLGVLFAKRCPGDTAPGYSARSWPAVLEQHGDEPVATPGWRLLRKEVVEKKRSYADQQKAVADKLWSLTSLIERVCLNLLMQIVSQYQCDRRDWVARTSTLTRDASGSSWPTATWWLSPSGSAARLCLDSTRDFVTDYIGVAVGMPAGRF